MIKQLQYFHIILYAILIYSCSGNGQTKLPYVQVSNKIAHGNSINKNKSEPIKYGAGNITTAGILDKDGNMWFTTLTEGVFKYDGTSFTKYTTVDGLCDNEVWSILEDKDGVLWFGTSDGLCTYDGRTFTHIPIPSYRYEAANTVITLFQDKDDNIWLGTLGGGAYQYDGINFKGVLQDAGRLQSDGHYNNAIKSIIQDSEDNIWFSSLTHGGITRYDGKNYINYFEEDGLCDDMVFTSFIDSKDNIWIGVIENGDLCCYNGKSFIHYTKSDGTCFNFVSCFYEDKSGKIWFGSEIENGLCIYDGKRFTPFSVEGSDKIPPTRFILEDAKGNIWIGGRLGSLWRYDGNNLEDFTQAKNE